MTIAIKTSSSRIGVHDDLSAVPSAAWNALLNSSATDEVFLTYEYQSAWWSVFQPGQLLLVTYHHDEELRALLPLYADSGMIYPVGTGADYIDIIGTVDAEVLTKMLHTALGAVNDPLGFQFFHVPAESPTVTLLAAASEQLGMACYEEQRWTCPYLDIAADPALATRTYSKKSLVRHERYFQRNGDLRFEDLTDPANIERHLDELFDQHISRWKATDSPSLFLSEDQRAFYRELARTVGRENRVRFTRVLWNDKPISLHFGFQYKDRFLWYKPSFDVALAKHSPGEVLLKHLLEGVVGSGFRRFDFGLGDEGFKKRFSNAEQQVVTLGIYRDQR